MDAEDFVIDDGGHGEAVEALDELFPELQAVASLALVIETIDSIDRTALVVASQQEEVFWVLDLVSHHQTDHFQILLAAVHIVSEEQVVTLGRKVSDFKNPEKVDILAVNITRYDKGRVQLDQVWLADENLL